jgi:hypothetical protein
MTHRTQAPRYCLTVISLMMLTLLLLSIVLLCQFARTAHHRDTEDAEAGIACSHLSALRAVVVVEK